MIDALVRKFLGTGGGSLLDFYLQNSIWINSLVFLYAAMVVFARRNYQIILRSILFDFYQKYESILPKKTPNQILTLLTKTKIMWESGIRASWFPFISLPTGYLLYWKNDRTLQKIFSTDALVKTIVEQTISRSK